MAGSEAIGAATAGAIAPEAGNGGGGGKMDIAGALKAIFEALTELVGGSQGQKTAKKGGGGGGSGKAGSDKASDKGCADKGDKAALRSKADQAPTNEAEKKEKDQQDMMAALFTLIMTILGGQDQQQPDAAEV
jgi:hypothetical protein